jgi:hypothetical protein
MNWLNEISGFPLLPFPGIVTLFFQNSAAVGKMTSCGSKFCARRKDGVYE